MINLLKQGINPLLALKIAGIQMKIFGLQKNMAIYLENKDTIKENKDNILNELNNINLIKLELNKIKADNKDIINEMKDLITYLEMLEERMKTDLSDLSDDKKIEDLIEIGNICRTTVEGINKIIESRMK